LGLAMPDRVPADYQTGAPILIYTPDSDDGKSDQIVFDLWMGSRGATPAMDATDGPLGWKRISAEMMERDSSIVLEGFGMVPDTGGAGRYRGGLGIFRKWRVLAAGRLWLRNLYSGTAATGLLGGMAGSPSVARITTADGTTDY